MYDVIVVGGRCAGSPTAMLLSRLGYRVLVLDRATFPSDTLSTHYIHQTGLAQLKKWGLLDDLEATGCPRITEATWWHGDIAIRGFGPACDGIDHAFAPRRTVLDAMLVEAARKSGAEVREGYSVSEVLWEDGRAVGVRGRAAQGETEELRAKVVIGADGRNSLVARQGGAAVYKERDPLTVVYYTYWTGLKRGYEVHLGELQQVGCMPTHDDAFLIQAALPNDQAARYRADIPGTYHRIVSEVAPDLAEEIQKNGTQAERFIGTKELPNYYRKPYGPGWALIGDAGYHKDPLTGQGITDAFRDAELLTDALDRVLREGADWDAELAGYEQARNTASEMLYEFTCQAATLELTERMRGAFKVMAQDRDEANFFLGVIAGTTGVLDYFAPEHMDMLAARAAALTDQEGVTQ